MRLLICQNGQQFIEQFKTILVTREVVYQLIMSNAFASKEIMCCPECFFGAVLDESEQPVLLFGHTAPHRLLIYSVDNKLNQQAVSLLANYVHEKKIDISGISASESICNEFLSFDKAHSYQRGISMDIMELRKVNDIELNSGHFRSANGEDLDLIARWHIAFNAEANGHLINYTEAYVKNQKRINDFYLFEDISGKICAMACVARKLLEGCCITMVYTDPTERGKGYCSTLMYHLAKLQLEKGYKYLGLFVDQENPISNHTYKKVGYRVLEDCIEFDRIIKKV